MPFKRVSWLTILISFNVALLVLNSVAIWKLYAHQAHEPTVLDVLIKRPITPPLIEYKDFISIMISGLSLMVTVLGIGLATIAVWGYATIRDAAQKRATETAEATSRDVAQATAARTVYEYLGSLGIDPATGQRQAAALYEDENGSGTPGPATTVGKQGVTDDDHRI